MGECEAGRTGSMGVGGMRCQDKNCTCDADGSTNAGNGVLSGA